MRSYLNATRRSPVVQAADKAHAEMQFLSADKGAEYDHIVEIDLSTLEPHINGPFTPDLSHKISEFKTKVLENNWPATLSAGLIGSCTNSSYEDMSRVVDIVSQAQKAGIKAKAPFLVTPGSEQIRATIERDGFTETLQASGATVLANACGPCVGQWTRKDIEKDSEGNLEANSILTSFNRNFRARNDGNPLTLNFLASPEIVTAMVFAGSITFDPTRDSIDSFQFKPPTGSQLPASNFTPGDENLIPSADVKPNPDAQVVIDPNSSRLQALEPFGPFEGEEFSDIRVLFKVKGKCTTDHISAVGPWLKYKGHLENISNNTLIGAENAETGEVNRAYDFDGSAMDIPSLARAWKSRGQQWLVIGDQNYGEGSAREHAALQPRFLGGRIILCRSFARIHETNLKKQGILPLTFVNEADYDKISSRDLVRTSGIKDMLEGKGLENGTIILHVTKNDGTEIEIPTKHTMSADQVAYFKAGSALSLVKEHAAKAKTN